MRLPRVPGREVVRALERTGFIVDRQHGSHIVLIHPQNRRRVTVPVHAGRIIKPGTLTGILDDAGLSVEEFIALL